MILSNSFALATKQVMADINNSTLEPNWQTLVEHEKQSTQFNEIIVQFKKNTGNKKDRLILTKSKWKNIETFIRYA